ncbi:hypothetical protein DL96DRAFT_1597202 [Flagelloscypha sp. PMI_526]|nr:hypothetical protein DL96DRAFT_1597202 [Flagelloscypha sp. PMI_526]
MPLLLSPPSPYLEPERPKATRGKYVSQACSPCRARKTKCDGQRPICRSCSHSGRTAECRWEPRQGTPKPPALVLKLQQRIRELEQQLEGCHVSTDCIIHVEDADSPWDADHSDAESSDSDHEAMNGIARPNEALRLTTHDDLVLSGPTSPFGFESDSAAPLPAGRVPTQNPGDRYDLQIPHHPSNPSNYLNPFLEWNRFLARDLPGNVNLTRIEHDFCLDRVFRYVLSWGQRIIVPMFLRDMASVLRNARENDIPKANHYSPMLHNALVALALSLSDDPTLRDPIVRDCFAQKAKGYIDYECKNPTLSAVHGLSILGTYYCANGDQSSSFLYSGMAARIGQALGLNFDCTPLVERGLIDDEHKRDRDWTWWSLYCQDVCQSAFAGREVSIPEPPRSRKKIEIPPVEVEFDKMMWYEHPNLWFDGNFVSLSFVWTCKLYVVCRKVTDLIGALRDDHGKCTILRQVDGLESQLYDWEQSVPTELQVHIPNENTHSHLPHILTLHCLRWWISILLHRPFFNRRSRTGQMNMHAKICETAADRIMDLMRNRRDLYTLRFVPVTAIQFVFASGTIYLLLALQAAANRESEAVPTFLAKTQFSIDYLHEMGQIFACANNVAKILTDLLEEKVRPRVQKRLGHAHEQQFTMDTDGGSRNGTHGGEYSRSVLLQPPTSSSSENGPPPSPLSPTYAPWFNWDHWTDYSSAQAGLGVQQVNFMPPLGQFPVPFDPMGMGGEAPGPDMYLAGQAFYELEYSSGDDGGSSPRHDRISIAGSPYLGGL